jgi:hypothetical protein
MANCFDSCPPRRPFEANTSEVAEATTSARSACTVEQQWRWHQLIDHVDNQHCEINVSDGTGVDSKEVESAFKANGDEERAFSHVPAMAVMCFVWKFRQPNIRVMLGLAIGAWAEM